MVDWNRVKILQQIIILERDEKAYKELYLTCFPFLTRFSFAFIHSKEKAEEIASDVLIGVWDKRKQLHRIDDLKLYLYKCTRNASLNALKKQRKTEYLSLEHSNIWLKTSDSTPEQLLISAEVFDKIQTAILKLPPKCRLIYKLIKEDRLKYKEVAELLEISVKTVEAQMSIAMKRLYLDLLDVVKESFGYLLK